MAATFDRLTAHWRAEATTVGWTVVQVAAALGVPPAAVWTLIWEGKLRAREIGPITVIELQELTGQLGML